MSASLAVVVGATVVDVVDAVDVVVAVDAVVLVVVATASDDHSTTITRALPHTRARQQKHTRALRTVVATKVAMQKVFDNVTYCSVSNEREHATESATLRGQTRQKGADLAGHL